MRDSSCKLSYKLKDQRDGEFFLKNNNYCGYLPPLLSEENYTAFFSQTETLFHLIFPRPAVFVLAGYQSFAKDKPIKT